MGICPVCGSWVDDGDICCECGSTGFDDVEDEDDGYLFMCRVMFPFAHDAMAGNDYYRDGDYLSAIDAYKRALGKTEDLLVCSYLNEAIGRSYENLGKHGRAIEYKDLARKCIDKYVKEEMEEGNKYFEEGEFELARNSYKNVLKYRDDAIAKVRFKKCEEVLDLDHKQIMEIKREFQKAKKRKERELKRKERELQWERDKIFREEQKKRWEEEKRKRKEECRKKPDCIKNEIEKLKKNIFNHSPVIFRTDKFQKDSDETFKEILELEELLEKRGIKTELTKEDINLLKKENRHLKYCLGYFKEEYRGNALTLFVKNHEKLGNLESNKSFKGISKVFSSDSKYIEEYYKKTANTNKNRKKINIE